MKNEKPILSLNFDCDQILSNFMDPAMKLMETITGKTYDKELCSSLRDMFSCEDLDEAAKIFDTQGYVENLKPYPEAIDGIKRLRELPVEIFCVTSSIETCPTWGYERYRWLEKHVNIDKHHTVITSAKDKVWGDLFVDDLPRNVNKWAERWIGFQAVMFERKYNEKEKCSSLVKRVQNWDQIYDLVVQMIDAKRENIL